MAGLVRYWPEPKPESGENAWGYAMRCSRTKDPATGLYHFPPQAIGSYGLMAKHHRRDAVAGAGRPDGAPGIG
ncbi:MAG: hypothetical protein IPN24_11245 [Betaproteobacteria bacterium]|nr:hypothetical protein [Betaproteobacteria bacterium]